MQKVKKTPKKTYTKHSGWAIFAKVVKGLVAFGILLTLIASLFLGQKFIAIAQDAPEADIDKFLSLSTQSVILDDAGEPMDRVLTDEVRIPVALKDINDNVKKAFIATEDERFYEHRGVDYRRTIGVTLKYALSKLVGGNYSQGGSTLTQQLIKNTFLTSEKVESRKIQEMYMALQIEKQVPKDKILETYLNSIFLGGRAYGVEAAAKQFFSKSAKDLSVIEAAYLAGVTTGPSIYYAFSESNEADPSLYIDRTIVVLGQMLKNEYLTQAEYDKYKEELKTKGIEFNYTPLTNGGIYNYEYFTRPVIEDVIQDLMEKYDISREKAKENLALNGYKIYSTMNRLAQDNAIKEINNEKNYNFKSYKDGNGVIQPQVAAVITEPSTGHVKAIVGGRGKQVANGANRATSPYYLRAIGSATKPLTVFTPGIDRKLFNSSTVFEDSPLTLEQREDYFFGDPEADPKDPTKPGNSYGKWYGYMNVKDALRRSSNLVTIKAHLQNGEQLAQSYAERFGLVLPPEEFRGTSMYALGQYANIDGKDGANPLIMAQAYGTFVNKGIKNENIFYTKVEDSQGNVILENKPKGDQIIKEGTAYIMWDALKYVVDSSSKISQAKFGSMPIGGKTGTSQGNKELWFAGASPYYSAAVFVGGDDHQPIIDKKTNQPMSSYDGGIKVFSKIMGAPHKGKELRDLPIPNDITRVAVSYDSGTLPTDLTRRDPRGDRTIHEWFFKDRVPKAMDNVHVEVEVNKLTGKLANFWTLPFLREKRVYITRKYKPEVKLEDEKYVLPAEYDEGPQKDNYTIPSTSPGTQSNETAPRPNQPQPNPPADTRPQETRPASTQPEGTRSEPSQPPATQPERTQPDRTQPERTQPEITQPERTKPQLTQPERTKPQLTQPERTSPATKPEVITLPKPTKPGNNR